MVHLHGREAVPPRVSSRLPSQFEDSSLEIAPYLPSHVESCLSTSHVEGTPPWAANYLTERMGKDTLFIASFLLESS